MTHATGNASDDDQFEQLLDKLVTDDLSPQQQIELAEQMQTQPAFVRRFTEAVHLRECLRDYSATDPHSANPVLSVERRSGQSRNAKRGLRPGWTLLAVAASLAMAVGLVAGRLLPSETPRSVAGDDQQQGLHSSPRPRLAVNDHQDGRLGSITGLSPAASAIGLLRPLQVGDELRRGEVVQLAHGVARIQLLAGPEVIVEAPAEVSIVDDHGIYVHQGRVSATAEGLITLQTALAAVEGEDAEFSALVEPDQPLQVFCHRGDTRVVSLRPGEGRPAVLRELKPSVGAEFYWTPDASFSKVVSIEHPGDIVRSWSQVTDRLHPYERVVLGDRPVAYWPLMQVRRNRRVLDLTQHGFDGQTVGAWPTESAAVALTQKRGAYFDGGCYIEPDTKPRIDLTNGFTIEGWANVTGGPEYQSVFTSRWVLGAGTSTQQCFGFTLYAGADDRWQFWSGSGEYGAGWQALTSDEPLERHRWTHVAARFRPLREAEGQWVEGAVELYVDGELAAEGVHRMSLIDFEWPARIGAAEFVPKSLTSWLFQGELRDIALYDYPLDDTQLQAHHKRGRGAT